MAKFLFTLLFTSSFALAHGPVAEQASHAVEEATALFLKTRPKEITRQFLSVSAILAGHEKFNVEITLKDTTTKFGFVCIENEMVDPVVWECTAT